MTSHQGAEPDPADLLRARLQQQLTDRGESADTVRRRRVSRERLSTTPEMRWRWNLRQWPKRQRDGQP